MENGEKNDKERKFLRTRTKAIKAVKEFAEENKDFFKGCKIGIYGAYTLEGDRHPKDVLGLVIEVPEGENEYESNRLMAVEKFKASIETKLTVYWFNSLRERELKAVEFRLRHGLPPREDSVYANVRDNKLVVWEG